MKLALALILLPVLGPAQGPENTTVYPTAYTSGIAESTQGYLPQIDTRIVAHPGRPENPLQPIPTGAINQLPVGGTNGPDLSRVTARFPGITFTGWRPPDPHVAAGPTTLVGVVNSSLAFFTKSNGALTFQQDFSTFFASLSPGSFIFDPKVIYDRIAGRFVVVALEEDDATQVSKILVAVSDDSDPAGTWFKYRIETKANVSGSSCWADYPGLGYNKDAYVLSFNMFGFTSNTTGTQFLKILKSSVLAGGTAATNTIINSNGAECIQVAEMYDPTITKIYALNQSTSASVKLWTLSNLTGAPTVATQSVTVPSFTIPGFGNQTVHSAFSRLLDALDGRIINCMYRGGKLVATHTVTQAPVDSRWRVRWYELNVPAAGAATLDQSGEVKETTATVTDMHMGGICKSPAGEIGLVFTRSSDAANIVADIMRTSRRATDPAGTMATPTLVQSSLGSSYGDASPAVNRWGDYCALTMDPVAENTFWAVHMDGDSGDWKTEIFSFLITNSVVSLTTTAANIVSGGPAPTLTVGLGANATAATNVSLVSSNPTLLSVPATVTVAASTSTKTFVPTLGTPVHANTAVVITASLGGTSRSVTEIIKPKVATITFTPTSAPGGGTAPVGTVTMSGAVTANTTINLHSSNAAVAIVPASVTVLSGQSTASFAVSLPAGVDSNTVVTITAPDNGGTGTLTVTPATLATFVLNFTSIAAGSPVTGTVTLNGKAGPAGRNVTVTSDNAVAFPTNPVKVAAGTNLKSFIISTRDASTSVLAHLTATLTGVITRNLSVFKGPALNNFTIIPGTVKGGTSSTGTPTIASAAPVGGVLIQFVESSPSVVMPLSALIPQGATSTPVGIVTLPVTVTTVVPITARNNGITKTKSVTITP